MFFFSKGICWHLYCKNQSIGLINFLWKGGTLFKYLDVFSSFATKWNTRELLIGWNAVIMVTVSLIYWFKKKIEHDITLNNSRFDSGTYVTNKKEKKNVLKSFWMIPWMGYQISYTNDNDCLYFKLKKKKLTEIVLVV